MSKIKLIGFFSLLLLLGGSIFAMILADRTDRTDRQRNTIERVPPYTTTDRARDLHQRSLVGDLHADSLLWSRDLLERHDYGHVDLPRLIEAGVAIQVFGVVTKSPKGQNYNRNSADSDNITALAMASGWPPRTWTSLKERALYQASRLDSAARNSGGKLVVIGSSAQLKHFLANRKTNSKTVAGLLLLEGCHALEGNLEAIDELYVAGFRILGLTHFFDNRIGGSSAGMEKGGLSKFGRQAIARMEALKMTVDLAHASPALIDDVLKVATRPIVVSHTGVNAIHPSSRNLSDSHLRRIAEGGGLIGIGFWKGAVGDISPKGVVRSIRHVADLIGIDYVALGSDFDGTTRTHFDVTGLVLITEALLNDGFSKEEVSKIIGGNQVRFLMDVLPE